MRTEPAVSLPIPMSHISSTTEIAAPDEEPPGTRSGSMGLCGVRSGDWYQGRERRTPTGSSGQRSPPPQRAGGRRRPHLSPPTEPRARNREPAVVRSPRSSNRSFSEIRTPSSGPSGVPSLARTSAASAAARALSRLTWMNVVRPCPRGSSIPCQRSFQPIPAPLHLGCPRSSQEPTRSSADIFLK